MATNRVSRGRKSQELAAIFLHPVFPDAAGIAASLPGRDILNTPGYAIEMKATKEFNPTTFLKQAAKNAGTDVPFAIYRPKGYGPEKVDQWVTMTTLGTMRGIIERIQQLERELAETEADFLQGYRQDLLNDGSA